MKLLQEVHSMLDKKYQAYPEYRLECKWLEIPSLEAGFLGTVEEIKMVQKIPKVFVVLKTYSKAQNMN